MADMSVDDYLTARFREFVACAHCDDGAVAPRVPYRWQCRLMLNVARHGRWPDRIVAPTAAGKTSVIDVHVFLNAMAGLQHQAEKNPDLCDVDGIAYADALAQVPLQRIPRRLALTVNRRSLVDDQYEEATALERVITTRDKDDTDSSSVLGEFRRGLCYRAGIDVSAQVVGDGVPLRVVELRGGLASTSESREWRYYPQTCAVICATPDMFGSRLLFRGYGTSATMRSLEAGLLAYDTVLVADEAHLSRQLVLTARQVQRLESMAECDSIRAAVTPLQVVETTATPTAAEDSGTCLESVSVEESDFAVDESLGRRLCTPKSAFVDRTATTQRQLLQAIVDRCKALVQENMAHDSEQGARVVGCILNTVAAAETVHGALSKALKKVTVRPVEAFVGPMRPHDKQSVLTKLYSASAGGESDETPCCVIGTQTLEVGVDVDFADLVTELAPGASLVQRAGRVNRRGLLPEAHIYVYGLSDDASNAEWNKARGPYDRETCTETAAWLDTLPGGTESGRDICAWSVLQGTLAGNTVPGEQARRLLYQRLEPWDVENLSYTDENLCGDVRIEELQQTPSDLDLWLRDALDDDDMPGIGVVVRDLPRDTAVAANLLELTPPVDAEVFPVRSRSQLVGRTKSLLSYLQEDGAALICSDSGERSDDAVYECRPRRAFLYRASEPEGQRVTELTASSGTSVESLRSGDIVIVDSYANLFSDAPMHLYAPDKSDCAPDVYNECLPEIGVVHIDMLANDKLTTLSRDRLAELTVLREQFEETAGESSERVGALKQGIDRIAQSLLDLHRPQGSLPVDRIRHVLVDTFDDAGEYDTRTKKNVPLERQEYHDLWVVVRFEDSLVGDEASQEISGGKTILLDGANGHQRHVADRACALAELVGLDSALAKSLDIAGLHHDDGKRDERFQRLLRRGRPRGNGEYWAKSVFASWRAERSFRERNHLRGWRHEQRSVAEYAAAVETSGFSADERTVDDQLIERLIGTSHGHGRAAFAHGSEFLIPAAAGQVDARVTAWARRLFDEGAWESLIDRTNRRYGYWGVSYLEAILRAADITSSKEGR